jgi:hypothetical protein
MKLLLSVSKCRQYWQDFFDGVKGAVGTRFHTDHTAILCLLLAGLSSLMGCGYAGRPQGMGEGQKTSSTSVIQAVPSSIGFGTVASGVPYSQSVRLSNTGVADVRITQAAVSGAGFSVSGLSLPLTLHAGQSTTFTAAFLSRTSGGVFGAITVIGDSSNSDTTISMSATVVADQVQLTPSVSPVNFGNDSVGNVDTQNVALTNTGNTDIMISSVAASGAGFGVAGGGSGVRLAPGQNTSIAVTFDPTATGAAVGSLTVTSNAPPLQIGLSGTGTNTPIQHSVVLRWNPSASTVTGYFVYRGDGLGGPLSKLTSIIPSTSYTDSTVVAGQAYNYAITSVDSENVESTYSNQASVTIPGN